MTKKEFFAVLNDLKPEFVESFDSYEQVLYIISCYYHHRAWVARKDGLDDMFRGYYKFAEGIQKALSDFGFDNGAF